MKKFLLQQADSGKVDSFAARCRRGRFKIFLDLLKLIKKPDIKILDLGGTVTFWENMEFNNLRKEKKVDIIVLNLMAQTSKHEFIKTVIGEACDLSRFKDKQFDVVFSNSVIEHLGTYENQIRMAREIIRVGKSYFVQTPNYYFPIEPHFLFPFFQFLPLSSKVFLLRYCNIGWYKKIDSKKKAAEAVSRIRLLKLSEIRKLFLCAEIYREKAFGLTKSFIAYKFYSDE